MVSLAGLTAYMIGTSAVAAEYSAQTTSNVSSDEEPTTTLSASVTTVDQEIELLLRSLDELERILREIRDRLDDDNEDEDEDEEDNEDEDEEDEEDEDEEDNEDEDEDEEDNDEDEPKDEIHAEIFEARLTGSNEVPPVTTTGSGIGQFTLKGNDLHYHITVQNLSSTLTAGHFHRGDEDVSGPVIEPITFNGLTASGVWMDLTNEELELLDDEEVYVNVHTTKFPNGEVRGQIDD